MIGNSLRTDIVPALEKNINAIYIPAETEWKYNIVDVKVKPKGTFFTLDSLRKVPDAIHSHIFKKDRSHKNPHLNYNTRGHDRKVEEDNLYS
jgi:putative hydrolase of the HAD superfamily